MRKSWGQGAEQAKEGRLRRKLEMAEFEDDAPDLGGRDVNRMAATGELNLRTWLDD